MKITYEFDTSKEDFDYCELHAVEDATKLVSVISKVLDLARRYEKYDNRDAIPTSEIIDKLREIVCDNLQMERYGY